MPEDFDIIAVDASNVDKTGFFCYMSKRKEPGYRQKRAWLAARFAEGLKIKIIHEHGGRDTAFIEYLPGEYAWRAVYAPAYLVIHCLWVVGKGRGKGYGVRLLEECLADARRQGRPGVVMLSSDRTWLPHKDFFLKNGFVELDQAPPSFQLLAFRFAPDAPLPALPQDWDARAAAFGPGLTVVRTDQCPYNENASNGILQFAASKGLPARLVTLHTAAQVREQAPCAYGAFGVVYNGRLFSYTYLTAADFEKLLDQHGG